MLYLPKKVVYKIVEGDEKAGSVERVTFRD